MRIDIDLRKEEKKYSEIGDLLIAEDGQILLLIHNRAVSNDFIYALLDIRDNSIVSETSQHMFYIGSDLPSVVDGWNTPTKVKEIIRQDRYKIVVE